MMEMKKEKANMEDAIFETRKEMDEQKKQFNNSDITIKLLKEESEEKTRTVMAYHREMGMLKAENKIL